MAHIILAQIYNPQKTKYHVAYKYTATCTWSVKRKYFHGKVWSVPSSFFATQRIDWGVLFLKKATSIQWFSESIENPSKRQ